MSTDDLTKADHVARSREAIRKRIRRSGYSQERHAPCLLCKKNFDTCPHPRSEVEAVIEQVRREGAARRWLG